MRDSAKSTTSALARTSKARSLIFGCLCLPFGVVFVETMDSLRNIGDGWTDSVHVKVSPDKSADTSSGLIEPVRTWMNTVHSMATMVMGARTLVADAFPQARGPGTRSTRGAHRAFHARPRLGP